MGQNINDALLKFLCEIKEPGKLIQRGENYYQYIIKDGSKIYVLKLVEGEFCTCVINKPKRKKINPSPKTKKGKIAVPDIPKIALFCAAFAILVITIEKKTTSKPKEEVTIEYQMSTKEYDLSKIEEYPIVIENNIDETLKTLEMQEQSKEQMENSFQENSIIQTIPFEINQSGDMIYRKETQELFGEIIEENSQRYGLPKSLIEALITQERHKQNSANPGQLTRNICGEEIILPIIHKNETDIINQKEVEKIYIVRDEPKRENFESEKSYIDELEKYKTQLEESKKLAKKGYLIISFENLLGESNAQENIRISIIWLAHCIYECNCELNKGVFAYNQGYPVANTSTTNEIMNGLAGHENADVWYNYNVYQYLTKEEANHMSFTLKPFPRDWALWNNQQKEHYLKEEIKETPTQNIALSLPIFNESLEEIKKR